MLQLVGLLLQGPLHDEIELVPELLDRHGLVLLDSSGLCQVRILFPRPSIYALQVYVVMSDRRPCA